MTDTHDSVASSRLYVLGLAAMTIAMAVLAVASAVGASVVAFGFFAVLALMAGWGVFRTCYRVELSDGYLTMRYLYRRRVVRLDTVRGIRLVDSDDDSPTKFEVSLDDGSRFRVTANRSTRPMMESIARRQPDVVVVGDITAATKLPPPPRTRSDDEFWSRKSRPSGG